MSFRQTCHVVDEQIKESRELKRDVFDVLGSSMMKQAAKAPELIDRAVKLIAEQAEINKQLLWQVSELRDRVNSLEILNR